MRKKLFSKLTMLVLTLGMSINTVWAGGSLAEMIPNLEIPANMKDQLMKQIYCARLTGKASSTGGGKVYATAPAIGESSAYDPRGNGDYVEGTSNVAVNGMGISMSEMSKMGINAWAESNDGYYFAGFSYADMGTDLGLSSGDDAPLGLYANTYVIGAQAGETIDYVIYGTFEPIRISGYTISGENTTSDRVCSQTINFTFSGNSEEISIADFESLSITSSKDGGSWTNESGEPLNISDLQVDGNNASLAIKFTAPDDEAKEYSANLQLKTKANIVINVPLNARTAVAGAEALRLNSKKVQYAENGSGDLLTLMNAAGEGDIIRLNGDYYASAVSITKNITFDLNGYTLDNTLTTSGSDVVLAYSPYGGTITGTVTVYSGKLTMNGGTINGAVSVKSGTELVQNGATINGAVTNNGTMTTTDGIHNSTLTSKGILVVNGGSFTPATGAAIDVISGKADIKKGKINSADVAIKSAGTTTIDKLTEFLYDGTYLSVSGGQTTVNCGKFSTMSSEYFTTSGSGEINFKSGYFKSSNDEDTFLGKHVWRNTSGAEYREGYAYFAGDEAAAKSVNVSVCHIGGTAYSTLEEALAYVNNAPNKDAKVTIIMDNDYTLPAGYYTLPQNAILIVPNSNTQGAETPIVERINTLGSLRNFRTLTLADGVNLDVYGTIEVNGYQFTALSGKTGSVTGDYARLQMNKGSRMTLQDGSVLRAWGFVTGDIDSQNAQHDVPTGEIDVRRGATVYELFQMGDWKNTMDNAMGLISGDSRFPINSYFIQNIEAPAKYHPGSRLITATSVSAAIFTMSANDINIIGVTGDGPAMFLMDAAADAENTWVRKWYDASKDQQVYEINSGAHIGNLLIRLASSPLLPYAGPAIGQVVGNESIAEVELPKDLIMNSGQYVLPITYNFKLHLLSGTLDFTQNTALIPGSELEINKGATVMITDVNNKDVLEGSLYVYDTEDWPNTPGILYYSPVFEGQPSTRPSLKDAEVNVHGTFNTENGYVLTTENGGNIFSSVEDAGTFLFTNPALAEDHEESVKVTPNDSVTFKSALLRNSDEYKTNGGNEYTKTAGAEEGQSYCFIDFDGTGGQWKSLTNIDCFVKDENDIYYAKPQEYVALASNQPNADHTYSDAAGKGRLFILLTDDDDNCTQWWEVEAKDNYFHCIHPDNDTYYEWKDGKWVEKKFTITWKDWDGSEITTYNVPYGTQAEWLSTNPKRESTVDYTYTFTGWSPALGKVTNDVTYTATYEEKQIKYTVVFVQDGGVEIERHLLARDEVPVCENVPTRTGYILQWEPGIEPVVGNKTYTATWLPEPPPTYTITFKNYDGTVLKKANGTDDAVYTVEAGLYPAYDGTTPTKTVNEGKEYTYEFTGWKPALVPATTNATYVAQFSENARTYEIKFYDENVSSVLKSENLEWGATPTPPAVSKTKTGYTYTYVWQNKDDATKAIESVKGAASYKPVFTETPNKYTVTLQCNVDGACTFTGAGIYDYNTSVTPTATIKDPTAYEFVEESWKEETTHSFGERKVTGDITLSAMVKAKDVELTDLEMGIYDEDTVSSATNYEDVIITSDGVEHSSQIINADNITLYGNADFVLKKSMVKMHWYDVAVPWRVDATSGIFLDNSTTPAVLGTDIELFYYNGATRAKVGPKDPCWEAVKNQSKKVLEPGRAYLFLIYKTNVSSVTFRKKVQEPLLTLNTSVQQYNSLTGDDQDGGWNGIANPALFKAYLNAGEVEQAQMINADGDGYEAFTITSKPLVVGQPVYVQVTAPKSPIVANSTAYAPAPARRMTTNDRPTRYEVIISAAGASRHADRLIVRVDESKEEDAYVIGKDLAKFGTGSSVAQMWVNRYDSKLCMNTVAPVGDAASFPMSVYAPKTGDYTIEIESAAEADGYALYLTYNGEAVWNLSDGAYTANITKGTDARYGLRVSARSPQVTTGVDEAIVDGKDKVATKVLINNQVYIIRGDKVYSIDGQLVK